MEEEINNSGAEEMEAAAPSSGNEMEAQEQETQQNMVPVDALQAERAQRQQMQEELKMLRDHVSLMQAQNSNQSQKKADDWDGLSEDDVLTVGEAKKAIGKLNSQYQSTFKELQMTQKYPDYQETITKYLPDVIKKNPSLRNTLETTQDYELAYYLAKNSEGYQKDHSARKKNADAQRIIKNAENSGSLASVGQSSPISQAKNYKQMSDDEFRKVVNRNMGYF